MKAAVVLALALAVSFPIPAAAAAHEDSIATFLRGVADRGTLSGLRWPRFPYYRHELDSLYMRTGWRPLWTVRGKPTGAAQAAIEALADAGARGLHSSDYDAALLDERAQALSRQRNPSAHDVAWFDAALSIELARHVTDIHLGRVNPKNLSIGINIDAKRFDRAKVVGWIAEHGHVDEVIRDLEPRLLQYRNLKKSLARYRLLAARTDLGPVKAEGTVRPGDHFEGAAALRRRLAAVGDFHASGALQGLGADTTLYDRLTAGAVRQFQERHGLDADSVLGPATVAAINVPFARRVEQFELAMERIRWLPEIAGPFIIVNVPSFRLYAFDTLRGNGLADLTMNVVVGRDQVGRQTPLFERDMRYIIFRPYWVVTRNILKNEILPAVRRNPGYLQKHNMEIYSGSGDTGPAVPTTSANLQRVIRGELGIRERPGPKNSLGLAKFIFPNDDHVFMHGTPAQELFSRSRRDFSHGCIRLEDPPRMAVWILRDPVMWPMSEVKKAMDGPKPRRVNLTKPLPVLLYYSTTVVAPDGTVRFFDDVYRHDATLVKVLAEGYPFAP